MRLVEKLNSHGIPVHLRGNCNFTVVRTGQSLSSKIEGTIDAQTWSFSNGIYSLFTKILISESTPWKLLRK